MKSEFETVRHTRADAINFLVIDISYRRPHLHFETEFVYVLAGSGTVRTEQTEYTLSAGQAIIFNSCQVHEFISEAPIRLLIVQFSATAFSAFYPPLDKLRFDGKPFEMEPQSQLFSNFLQCAISYFQDTEHLPLLTHGLLLLFLFELLQLGKFAILNQSQQNRQLDLQERIGRISSYIQENYQETISLSELADQEGFSRTYFSHFFKNNFGISFQEYLENIRCEYGRRLLITTSENLLTITNACGFADVRTFNKAFERRYKRTPKLFRKEHGSEGLQEDSPKMTNGIDVQRIFNDAESLALLRNLS